MCYFPWGAIIASRIFVVVADLASQKVSFHSPRYEIYGGTNNSVLNFYPKWSLFLCSVTYEEDKSANYSQWLTMGY